MGSDRAHVWKASFGDFTLFAIVDGWFHVQPTDFLPDSDPAVWAAHRHYLQPDGSLRVTLGCYLLITPSRTVLIDTGAGGSPMPGPGGAAGMLPTALAEVGVPAREVDLVVHTHLHFDHFGGDLTPEGEPAFPNARFHVHRAELSYWLGEAEGERAERVRRGFTPLVDQGRVEPLDGEHEVATGVTVIETPGHTPGHVSVVAVSGGQRSYIAGDLTHHPIQLRHPTWNVVADLDPARARATRLRSFESIAGSGALLAAGHYPPPGLGRVVADDGVRVFLPIRAVPVGGS